MNIKLLVGNSLTFTLELYQLEHLLGLTLAEQSPTSKELAAPLSKALNIAKQIEAKTMPEEGGLLALDDVCDLPQDLMPVSKAAVYANFSRSWLYTRIKQGRLKTYEVSGAFNLVSLADVKRMKRTKRK